jgi:CBS domain-containing protein
MHIKLAKIPFLDCEPHLSHHEVDEYETLFVSQIMSTPVVTLNKIEKVSNIIMILQNETHNGFPVVDLGEDGELAAEPASPTSQQSNGFNSKIGDPNASYTNLLRDFGNLDEAGFESANEASMMNSAVSMDTVAASNNHLNENGFPASNYRTQMKSSQRRRHYGKLRGFVLRWQLIVMLEYKIFNETCETSYPRMNLNIFRDAYPRYPGIQSVISKLTSQEMEYTIDLNHVMNPSPYSVAYNFTFNRTFRLFRALGLRHLCVVNDRNLVVGIITRKDIANFQVLLYKGRKYIQKYSDTINDRLS